MLESDPNAIQLGFFGQYGQTYHPTDHIYTPSFIPTGRLREAAPYLSVKVLWEDDEPDPDIFNLSYFEDVLLIRDPLRNKFNIPQGWVLISAPWPQCVYHFAHWMSARTPLVPGNIPNHIANWYLFYGTEIGLDAQNLLDEPFPPSDTPMVPYGVDSQIIDADPSSINTNNMVQRGWGLHLISRSVVAAGPDDSEIKTHLYGSWQLMPTEDERQKNPAIGIPMLDLTKTSQWVTVHNALNWPAHTIEVAPFPPRSEPPPEEPD